MCSGSNACRQYCEAMRSQGIAVEFGADGCNVPSMLKVNKKAITFNPVVAGPESIQNPELVNKLCGALIGVLVERAENADENQAVGELITDYSANFATHVDLWQGMLKAPRENRRFTDMELAFYQEKLAQSTEALQKRSIDALPDSIIRAQAAADHITLDEHGLMFDDQILGVVDRLVGNLMDSKPALIVGDKGIAKTQVAKFVAKLWDPTREPTIISGHGDMMSNELIGQMEQDKESRVFAFKEGKLVQAMREGRPVVLDEVNIGDHAVMMRLQDILLLRPGQQISLQENGGNTIIVQPGFVVFATANEASARYNQRQELDLAFRDRYDIIKMQYPDSVSIADTSKYSPIESIPRSLMRLALASAVDEKGVLSSHIDANLLEKLVRLAHVTQYLYSVPSKNASNLAIPEIKASTSSILEDEPVMTDCISPRVLADTVKRCSAGNKPGMNLDKESERLILGLDQAGSRYNQSIARGALKLLQG